MAFSPPLYNATSRWWRTGVVPFGNPQDGVMQIQLYFPTKGLFDATPGSPLVWVPPTYARISPANLQNMKTISGTVVGCSLDITDSFFRPWYYRVRYWEFSHFGFSNEYASLILDQIDSTGIIPDPNR